MVGEVIQVLLLGSESRGTKLVFIKPNGQSESLSLGVFMTNLFKDSIASFRSKYIFVPEFGEKAK